tara:strand:+ start:1282 stop:2064 length:783 start_codon:yes stop_codon:yes gene_type:complete
MISLIKNPFVFIGIIALNAALILATFSESTKVRVKNNKDLDRKKNVLLARYLEDQDNPNLAKLANENDLQKIYEEQIEELIFNQDALLVEDLPNNLSFSDLVWKEDSNAGSGKEGRMIYSFKNDDTEYLPLFKVKESGGFVIPISGKGLWSTIKGFIYVVPNDDSKIKEWDYSVKGISFYEHGETPGLGGEIDKYEVQARYLNKQVSFKNNKTPEMTKTVSDDRYDLEYISGATITSDGLDTFIAYHILDRYKDILSKAN